MIARRQAEPASRDDLWAMLAAPLPPEEIQWRIDGKPLERNGKYFARFVAYIDAQFVRQRLDLVVAGEWDLSLELLPSLTANGDGEALEEPCAFKARLQILGVIREDVGMGRDYKSASTDAFKRAAVRFGIGSELYAMEPNWVQVDGNGRYTKPVEDPGFAYERRYGRAKGVTEAAAQQNARDLPRAAEPAPATSEAPPADDPPTKPQHEEGGPACPKCGGRTWDNRLSKRNPKAPDFKCRDRSCDGVIWPPKATEERDATGTRRPKAAAPAPSEPPEYGETPGVDDRHAPTDELPF